MTADIVRTIAKGICCGAAGKCLAETRPCAAFVHDPTAIRALAALDAARLAVVPKEATSEMWRGFRSVNCDYDDTTQHAYFHGDIGNFRACYDAMLSAAPTAQPAEKPSTILNANSRGLTFHTSAGRIENASFDASGKFVGPVNPTKPVVLPEDFFVTNEQGTYLNAEPAAPKPKP